MPPEIVSLQPIGAVDSLMTPDSEMPEFWIVCSLKGGNLETFTNRACIFSTFFSECMCNFVRTQLGSAPDL
jgi:hypothetical protein